MAAGRRPPAPLLRPQRLLQQAAQDAARLVQPTGIGLDSPGVRLRMVERLRRQGVGNEAVLGAFARVPRHQFVDSALAPQAYEDTALPIGHGQTISKPSVVARMLELALQGQGASRLGHLGRVLEIGTGCGYQAALLACLASRVHSIERIGPLYQQARQRLLPLQLELGLASLRLRHADGREGEPASAPFDTVIAAAGGEALPPAWLAQLAVGGRLVAPMQTADGRGQVLMVVDHVQGPGGSEYRSSQHEGVHFVPLKSGLLP